MASGNQYFKPNTSMQLPAIAIGKRIAVTGFCLPALRRVTYIVIIYSKYTHKAYWEIHFLGTSFKTDESQQKRVRILLGTNDQSGTVLPVGFSGRVHSWLIVSSQMMEGASGTTQPAKYTIIVFSSFSWISDTWCSTQTLFIFLFNLKTSLSVHFTGN